MTVPVIVCIPSYAHVCARIAASTYIIHANNVLAKFMVCDATKFTFLRPSSFSWKVWPARLAVGVLTRALGEL